MDSRGERETLRQHLRSRYASSISVPRFWRRVSVDVETQEEIQEREELV
jgi:hypothetical protein